MTSLLMHSEQVPASVRAAIKAAESATGNERNRGLESAARILYAETGLDCADARELVDLGAGNCGCD